MSSTATEAPPSGGAAAGARSPRRGRARRSPGRSGGRAARARRARAARRGRAVRTVAAKPLNDARVRAHVGEPHAAGAERRAQRRGLVAQRRLVGPLRRGVADPGRAERGPRQPHDHARPGRARLARRAPVVGRGVAAARRRAPPPPPPSSQPGEHGAGGDQQRERDGDGEAAPGRGAGAALPRRGRLVGHGWWIRPRAGGGGRRWRRRPAPGSRGTGRARPSGRRRRSSRRCPCTARAAAP